MLVKSIRSKSILSKSKVADYSLNPYIGCMHGCTYCYAKYMKRFTGHREAWGAFVDVKTNAASLLQHELRRKKPGKVWLSGTCDPYQPIEERTNITRECLRLLSKQGWPVTIQTKSPLILRDLDLLTKSQRIDVIISITTANDMVRKVFEPHAPSIHHRLQALTTLHASQVSTSAMIAPLLPYSEELLPQLRDIVDFIIIDKMNYKNLNIPYLGYQLSDVCPICHQQIKTHDVHLHHVQEI
jgi:DNA repair photolyase